MVHSPNVRIGTHAEAWAESRLAGGDKSNYNAFIYTLVHHPSLKKKPSKDDADENTELVAIRFPPAILDKLEQIVGKGYYKDRSEAVRFAVLEFVKANDTG